MINFIGNRESPIFAVVQWIRRIYIAGGAAMTFPSVNVSDVLRLATAYAIPTIRCDAQVLNQPT